MHFVHTTCGEPFAPHVSCSTCGQAIDPQQIAYESGPGGGLSEEVCKGVI